MGESSNAVHPFFQARTFKQHSPDTASEPLTSTTTPTVDSGSSVSSATPNTEKRPKKQVNQSVLYQLFKPSTPVLQKAELSEAKINAKTSPKIARNRGKGKRKAADSSNEQAAKMDSEHKDEQKEQDKENDVEMKQTRAKKRVKQNTSKDTKATFDTGAANTLSKTDKDTVMDNEQKLTKEQDWKKSDKNEEVTDPADVVNGKQKTTAPSARSARKSARIAAKHSSKTAQQEQQQKSESSKPFLGRRRPSPPALEYCTESFAALMEGPQFYHDPEDVYREFEREILYNMYGIDKKKTTKRKNNRSHDHEFSRLDADIFGTGHITATADKTDTYPDERLKKVGNTPHARRSRSKSQVNIRDLVRNGHTSFFQLQKAVREKQCKQSTRNTITNTFKVQNELTTKADVEKFLDTYFPRWHAYSSCVLLLQSIFESKNRPKNDYFIRENMKKQWTDKYRPTTVDELLGGRHNFVYLRDWLQQMKIEPISASSKGNGKKKKVKSKRKKLVMMNEDFIVDEDGLTFSSDGVQQALNSYDNDDEDDDDFAPKPASSAAKRKLQLQKEAMKSNIILLVGDHGIGKTAAVYTIAEQLGYEVFEINPGFKRSGKDIVSMVGDMTKNHLVAFNNAPPSSAASLFVDKPPSSSSSSSANEDSDGNKRKKKRGLNPLFKTSASIEEQKTTRISVSKLPNGKTKTIQEKKAENGDQAPSTKAHGLLKHLIRKTDSSKQNKLLTSTVAATATTKQSLVLLEEVDILFEEDKGFWSSVIELSQSSKRPIVMTCNDPDQIPFENLCLQIVLDVKPPKEQELLPYLWLLCFCEGHIVDPKDLLCFMALFGSDVRKLIQTLDVDLSSKEQRPVFLNHLDISMPNTTDRTDREVEKSNVELLVNTRKKCIPSKLAVDTFRLATAYEELLDVNRAGGTVISHGSNKNEKVEEELKELDSLTWAIDNNAFVDSYLTWNHKGANVYESQADLVNGCPTLMIEDENMDDKSASILHDLESRISILNSDIYNKSFSSAEGWNKLILEEGSHWDELCDSRILAQDDYKEAVDKLLPLAYIYQPDEDVLMMEYIPYIQSMVTAEDGVVNKAKRPRSTRSKRKRRYLPLNDECVKMLISTRAISDETEYVKKKLESFNNKELPSAEEPRYS